jgi:transcriptional regulator GlxA family with amidase domain
MIRVALLAFEDCFASGVTGIADVLMAANHLVRKDFGKDARCFDWCFVSADGASVIASNGLRMVTQEGLHERPYDLVFIPAVYYRGAAAFDRWIRAQRSIAEWLAQQWRAGAVLATYGAGSFLLAEAGLLDGRLAVTAWWLQDRFRKRYPRVRLRERELMIDADRLVCVGAGASYLYLVIRLVERFLSPEIAQNCVRALQIDIGSSVQSPYPQTGPRITREDSLVNAALHAMQQHLAAEVRIVALAHQLKVSQSTLIRRFKRVTGMSPQMVLQDLRVRRAQQWLATSDLTVEEIVERVGYADVSSFTRLFQHRTGLSPGEYRRDVKSQGSFPMPG